MNTSVVFDSQYGNTEQVAQAIAHTLKEFGAAHAKLVTEVDLRELPDVDLLVLGCPTQGWRPTLAMLTFLAQMTPATWQGVAIACFDTRLPWPRFLTGSAAHYLARQLRTAGALVVAPPESFFVKGGKGPLVAGELQRADGWARALQRRIDEQSPALSLTG
jgi:flavodoxin